MKKLVTCGLTLQEPNPMSTPKVQYDIAEKGSDVDADGHFKTRVALPRIQKWYQWYNQDDTPEERRLVLKLDLLVLIRVGFVFLDYHLVRVAPAAP